MTEISNHKYVSADVFAAIYTGFGEKDRAIEWLEKGYEERSLGGPPTGI